ncbi:hypothetical protein SDC9_156454 [bioreactor metagenome]|uniref:Uncharacterized protein n=1 Tax=bioreactor metagenome TaxID=1076179 RepID=A0A645F6A7_9ZZZZ
MPGLIVFAGHHQQINVISLGSQAGVHEFFLIIEEEGVIAFMDQAFFNQGSKGLILGIKDFVQKGQNVFRGQTFQAI